MHLSITFNAGNKTLEKLVHIGINKWPMNITRPMMKQTNQNAKMQTPHQNCRCFFVPT